MNSKEEILNRMLSDIKNEASKIEGSFTMDNLESVANELARFYDIDYGLLLDRVFIDTAIGDDLDRVGIYNHGIKRKEATFSEVNVLIRAKAGSIIDESIVFVADTLRFSATGKFVVSDSGVLNLTLRCLEAGSGKKIQAGSIRFLENYEGLISVVNEEASSDGADRESDEDYRKRIKELEKEVKGYGNISYYKLLAKSIVGVDRVKVIDLARGLGTVDIVIIADDNKEASNSLIEKVKELVSKEKMAGADINIYSATKKDISINASIYHNNSYTTSFIKEEFSKRINEYFKSLDFNSKLEKIRVSYAKILNILVTTSGVEDVSNLQINNMTNSIELEIKEFPILLNINIEKVE